MDTATKDGGHTWTFGNQIWQQTPDGRFSLHSIAGVKTSDTRIDLDYLAGARLPAESSSDYLPAAFRFCPQSGQELLPARGDRRNRWLPPYGSGSGSRVIADDELESAQQIVANVFARLEAGSTRDLNDSKEIIKAPGKNGLHFFVADAGGYRDALFALSRDGGLHLWLRSAGKWQQLLAESTPIGGIALQHWAWSVALLEGPRGHDLLIAGSSGAMLVSVEPWTGKYRLQTYPGESLAGAGELAGAHWLPMKMADGSVQLVGRSGKEWKTLPIAGSASAALFAQLSAPLIDLATGRLLWVGQHGYLTLQQAGLQAHWQAWPNNASASPRMGPPFRDGNGLWQLISEADGGDYYVQLDSRATGRFGPIKGSRLSTGHVSFRNNIRMNIPWNEDHDEQREPVIDQMTYPFIEFTGGKYLLSLRGPADTRAKEFLGSAESQQVEYCLSQIDGVSFSLDAKVREPWNAQWFFFDKAMWLYIDSVGEIYRWKA